MSARRVAVIAVSIALVFVLVRFIQVPIVASGGVTHPGAVAEVFVALAFGPVVGMLAAGLGAAIADAFSQYAHFIPLTLLAHGALGYLVGLLGWKKAWPGRLSGWLAGGAALVAVYFAGEALFEDLYGGSPAAIAELPFNVFQVALGFLGLLLFVLVRQAYPRIEQLSQDTHFEEL
jgi:uncharacterized membrane protein